MKNLKTIMETHNHTVDFPFMGETFTVAANRNIYNEMRKKYQSMIPRAVEKFRTYHYRFENFEDLIKTAFAGNIGLGVCWT